MLIYSVFSQRQSIKRVLLNLIVFKLSALLPQRDFNELDLAPLVRS